MKEILEYQDTDLKIKRIEAEIANSESKKNATEMQNMLRALQEKLQNLEQQAAAVNAKFNKLEAGLEEATKKFQQINKKAENISGDAANELSEIALQIKNILLTYEKEISALNRNAENLSKELETVMKNAKTAKRNLIFYREQYDKLRASKESELKELKNRLSAQEKKVDAKILAKYHAKSTGRMTKVIVPLENGRCGGCKMEVAANGLAKLQKEKLMECENCGRIIYMN